MKTSDLIKIFFLSAAIFSSGACSKHQSQAQQDPPARPTTPPLNQEAQAFAETRHIESWIKVGDSWFILSSYEEPKYFQVKGMNCVVTSELLSEAETLNGVEWSGAVYFLNSAYREYASQTHTWSEWRNGEPPDVHPTLSHRISKVKGKWGDDLVHGHEYHKPDNLTKPSEDQIKIILGQ